MAWTDIQKIKIEVGDMDPAFPLLSDDTYAYILEKNSNNISRASLDAARTILMVLSQRSDETVDIFSIRGSKTAETFRLALQMYLANPLLNPILQNVRGYVGGVSNSDMEANDVNPDNNTVQSPSSYNSFPLQGSTSVFPVGYFSV
jgi:hypothetical protein